MKTIMQTIHNEIIINKSKFISYIFQIHDVKEFKYYYDKLKSEYSDATHICYAYIIDNNIKYYDDGEPTGSAGIPILEVIKKNSLNHIVAFVIRYYGGIKLGSSGLIRAYSNSTSIALKTGVIIPLEKYVKIRIIASYEQIKTIENIINQKEIIEKNFTNCITYLIITKQDTINLLNKQNILYEIIDKTYY